MSGFCGMMAEKSPVEIGLHRVLYIDKLGFVAPTN